jgi:hypothetical protein
MIQKRVNVHNRMQRGYSYLCAAPQGKDFDPEFRPDLTPREMLALGVFGGVYLRDCTDEFPASWFTHAKFQKEGVYVPDPTLNFFGVTAGQPLSVWRKKGWIYENDPRGWFEWYCRYYLGRRIPEEDRRQIRRWKAMTRHVAQVQKNCDTGDLSCHARQRQALLHWAYDSRTL